MVPIWLAVGTIFFSFVIWANRRLKPSYKCEGKPVPNAWSSLNLIIGNGFQVASDPVNFFKKCHALYGGLFRIKIYRAEYIIVADDNSRHDLTKVVESKFSFYDFLDELSFTQSFFDVHIPLCPETIRKGIVFNLSTVTPILKQTAIELVETLKKGELNTPMAYSKQSEYFSRYAAQVFTRCFLNLELDESMFQTLMTFYTLIKNLIFGSYFIPTWLINLATRRYMGNLRKKIRSYVEDTIIEYQHEGSKLGSNLFRAAADKIDVNTGENFSAEQISGIMLSILFAGTQNTYNLIQNALVDISQDRQLYEELREELIVHIKNDDMNAIYQSKLLNACVMETSRLNPTLFGLFRKCRADTIFAGYSIKKGEILAISNPNLMLGETLYKNATKYKPRRFLGPNPESLAHHHVINWGAGLHLCPGKTFALYETKMALAYLLANFTFEVAASKIRVNYGSTSAFAERNVRMIFSPTD